MIFNAVWVAAVHALLIMSFWIIDTTEYIYTESILYPWSVWIYSIIIENVLFKSTPPLWMAVDLSMR